MRCRPKSLPKEDNDPKKPVSRLRLSILQEDATEQVDQTVISRLPKKLIAQAPKATDKKS